MIEPDFLNVPETY